MQKRLALAALLATAPAAALAQAGSPRDNIDTLIETHARANKVPPAFVHRVIKRESNYNPRAKGGSALGLMQIKHATARGLGYGGDASGLFDPEVNLKYGIAYLAGAYRAAKGDLDQAYRYYNRGYYYAAKQLGITNSVPDEAPAPVAPAATSPTGFASLFGLRTNTAPAVQTASADAGAPLAYAPAAGSAQAVEVPLPPQRPVALAGSAVETPAAALAEATIVPTPGAGATAAPAQPAAQAASDQIEVPLPPRRPAAVQLAAVKRPASAPKTDAAELLQAAAQ